ncbi:MAG TPA: hypothetical protein VFV96_05230 [Verrucomicrobiae bacterium]|nr:hypothetical protein [Verrucomicrobiae bacterium]
MMEFERQLKIQAFLDGELPEAEAREVAAWIAADAEATALQVELKNTRRALRGAEQGVAVPETREFYWSKISREIAKLECDQPAPAPAFSGWRVFNRWIKSLGAVAAVLTVGLIAWEAMNNSSAGNGLVTAAVDADAITFQDSSSGTTFVWFNFPAEKVVANGADRTSLK